MSSNDKITSTTTSINSEGNDSNQDRPQKKHKSTNNKEEENKLLFLNYIDDDDLLLHNANDKLMIIPTQGTIKSPVYGKLSNLSKLMYHEKLRNIYNSYFGYNENDMRMEFLFNLILKWKEMELKVVKYDPIKSRFFFPCRQEIIRLIKNRLTHQKSQKKTVKTPTNQSVTSKYKVFVEEVSKVYDLALSPEETSNQNFYSTIHTMYSSWSFYLYPFTHRLKTGHDFPIHSMSKMKLKFPTYPTMYVVFDGRTVHHGAETKFSSLSSTCVSMDERLFSYVTVHKKINEINSRKSKRQQLHGRSADAGVHRADIKMCYELGECPKCLSNQRNDYFELDLGQLYEEIKGSKSGRNIKQKPLIGDLKLYGFEVWIGENTRSTDYIDLKFDLRDLSKNKNKWKLIDVKVPRCLAPVARTQLNDNVISSDSIDMLVNNIEELLKKRTFPDREVIVGKTTIISNRGFLFEQFPHRDYPTETDDKYKKSV